MNSQLLYNPLKNYHILIVDADVEISRVLKAMLAEMGFINVQTTRSGKEAVGILCSSKFDFVITEWNTQHMDGMSLLKFLRRNPNSPNMTIPVIMLTGRAEIADVFMARDYGINEYVVKPFTANSIYSRLERIIEQPRNFVVSENFIGPCRRTRQLSPGLTKERRKHNAPQNIEEKDIREIIKNIGSEAQILKADFSLKMKLGKESSLSSFITQNILRQTQKHIDSITSSSMLWIKENLSEIKNLHESMFSGEYPSSIASDISEVALIISSRSGTFGYSRASEIAYNLYLFARNKLDPKNNGHRIVVQKNIEVLHVILGNTMRGDAGVVGGKVATELKALVAKYSKD